MEKYEKMGYDKLYISGWSGLWKIIIEILMLDENTGEKEEFVTKW